MGNREDIPGMITVEYPAVSFAKKVCCIAMVLCIAMLVMWYGMPTSPITLFIATNQMLIVYILGAIVVIAAIRAFIQAFSK